MITKKRITETVFSAIDEVNGQLPQESQVGKSVDTMLIGVQGSLDSMGFVFLIVATEQKIVEKFGIKVTLIDDGTFRDGLPFQTVAKFIDYVFDILDRERK